MSAEPSGVWQQQYQLRSGSLAALLVLAAVYLVWQASLPEVTENDRMYGVAGMLSGCSSARAPRPTPSMSSSSSASRSAAP